MWGLASNGWPQGGQGQGVVAAFARTRVNPAGATNPHSGECGYIRLANDDDVAAFARTRVNPAGATYPHSGECGYPEGKDDDVAAFARTRVNPAGATDTATSTSRASASAARSAATSRYSRIAEAIFSKASASVAPSAAPGQARNCHAASLFGLMECNLVNHRNLLRPQVYRGIASRYNLCEWHRYQTTRCKGESPS